MVVFEDARLIMNSLPTKEDDIFRQSICELASEALTRLLLGRELRMEAKKQFRGMIIDGQSLNHSSARVS
jgi:hypothetical protein